MDNLTESLIGSNPSASDSDGDGYGDGEEVDKGSDPLLADSTPRPIVPGDLNRDDQLDVRDLVSILRFLQGVGPEPSPAERADVNGDGKIDMADAVQLAKSLMEQSE